MKRVLALVAASALGLLGWALLSREKPPPEGSVEPQKQRSGRNRAAGKKRQGDVTERAAPREGAQPAVNRPPSRSQSNKKTALDPERADKIRALLEAARATRNARAEEVPPPPEQAFARMPAFRPGDDESANALSEYVEGVLAEQYMPLIKDCGEQRSEKPAGRIVIATHVGGTAEVGGVVEDAYVQEETTIEDEEFLTCVRESLYAVVFDAPPEDNVPLSVRIDVSLNEESE